MQRKGFVVSAVLYPLLVLFLALMMGLLAMTDTRKRIFDKMKLEISDSIFDDSECSCETISSKLDYLIKHGVGVSNTSHLGIKVTAYETYHDFPGIKNNVSDIGIVSTIEVKDYLLSSTRPEYIEEGLVWIKTKELNGEYQGLGELITEDMITKVAYVEQCQNGEWVSVQAAIWTGKEWQQLNYKNLETATVEDMIEGKTAIVNGNLVTGEKPVSNKNEVAIWNYLSATTSTNRRIPITDFNTDLAELHDATTLKINFTGKIKIYYLYVDAKYSGQCSIYHNNVVIMSHNKHNYDKSWISEELNVTNGDTFHTIASGGQTGAYNLGVFMVIIRVA